MEQSTKLNEKQATAAVKVVCNQIEHQMYRVAPEPTNIVSIL